MFIFTLVRSLVPGFDTPGPRLLAQRRAQWDVEPQANDRGTPLLQRVVKQDKSGGSVGTANFSIRAGRAKQIAKF